MKVLVDASPLRETTWKGHLGRFLAGGAATVCTGLVAEGWGPAIGGFFLAFPAIFPVGVAMLESLQNKKAGPGCLGHRARRAAVAQAAGAALGSLGLVAFALTVWLGTPRLGAQASLALGAATWMIVAVAAWATRRLLVAKLAQ